jgi:hypothetical protein
VNDRENLGAGIYAALIALAMLVAFLGAFYLPLPSSVYEWIGILALVAYLLVMPILLRLAHRSRIRDAVGTIGGTVVRIKKLPSWKQAFSPKYTFFLGLRFEVEYVDLLGATHRALCNSGFFQGVEWVADVVVGKA